VNDRPTDGRDHTLLRPDDALVKIDDDLRTIPFLERRIAEDRMYLLVNKVCSRTNILRDLVIE